MASGGRTTSPGATAKSAPAAGSFPFVAGEQLSYDVSLLGIRTAEAKLKVDAGTDGGFRFSADGRTVGASDSLLGMRQEAMCSVDGGLAPSLCRFTSEKRGGMRRRELKFDAASGNVRERTLEEGKREEKEVHFDDGLGDVQDALSGLYLLRSKLSNEPGQTVEFRSMRKGKPITVRAVTGVPETVTTPAGTFEASPVKLDILEQQEADATVAATVWLTTDARRIPVKLSAAAPVGTLEAKLTGAVGTAKGELAAK
ncbi:DUF3108 domain-containing protein [Vulgatibacter incomptus]|uniref:DUF3108 domain-containing protein n=1 Tax=Vulgatibacter incomptus TaxID=1391653 RepID=UPI001969A43E|nr:DUF3108 domain-containing protein [Vulgatibacter incomptus]